MCYLFLIQKNNMNILKRRKNVISILTLCSILYALCLFTVEAAETKIETNEQGGYQLTVDGEPFLVKGVVYHPIPPGYDYTYNFWQDLEAVSRDAKLMREAGFNAVRFYASSADNEHTKKVIQTLYENGIYTVMGHWLGFWNYPAPFYCDAGFQEEVKQDVLRMVKALKDEPGVIMWILGNENNYSFSGKVNPWSCPEIDRVEDPCRKISEKAGVYYSFVNDIAAEIKKNDSGHPVGLGNGELITLDIAKENAKDLDFLALIFYRGKGFGNIFNSVRYIFDKPVLISEMGSDAYNAYSKKEAQAEQAEFLLSQWTDVYENTVRADQEGNCLGAIIFEWNDEWWKYHDTLGTWSNGAYYFDIKAARNLNMNEEWFGIVAFEKNDEGQYVKAPRKAYYVLREFFGNPEKFIDNE